MWYSMDKDGAEMTDYKSILLYYYTGNSYHLRLFAYNRHQDDKKSKGVESETAFAGNITGC